MKRTIVCAAVAASALAGTGLIGSPATASDIVHCDSAVYPSKIELVDAGPTAYTGLAEGTVVCIKAGTQTVGVTVDEFGYITQDAIMNKPGTAFLGISYYAFGEGSSG
jgi:hypothetical protein